MKPSCFLGIQRHVTTLNESSTAGKKTLITTVESFFLHHSVNSESSNDFSYDDLMIRFYRIKTLELQLIVLSLDVKTSTILLVKKPSVNDNMRYERDITKIRKSISTLS